VTIVFDRQDMAKAGTPSRLQANSLPVAPRVALHSLEGTLAGNLLAALPPGTRMSPDEDMSAVSEAVRELDSTAAVDFTLAASEVCCQTALKDLAPLSTN
jgi:hypothetical protein